MGTVIRAWILCSNMALIQKWDQLFMGMCSCILDSMAKGRVKTSDSKSENDCEITSDIPLKELKHLGGVEV